jgi:hypothetical protein
MAWAKKGQCCFPYGKDSDAETKSEQAREKLAHTQDGGAIEA